jgi:hypothetical protein
MLSPVALHNHRLKPAAKTSVPKSALRKLTYKLVSGVGCISWKHVWDTVLLTVTWMLTTCSGCWAMSQWLQAFVFDSKDVSLEISLMLQYAGAGHITSPTTSHLTLLHRSTTATLRSP